MSGAMTDAAPSLPSSTGWEKFGACRQYPGPRRIFFSKGPLAIEEAKGVCATCLVRPECLKFALATPVVGVWGGTTQEERRALSGRTRRYTPSLTGRRRRRRAKDTAPV
jgi:WhiB family redox-sensing transcriptional regulator